MARNFPNLSFGPMHLRPVLRRRFERGEHLIAWGQASSSDDQKLFLIAMGLVPAVGPAFAAVASASNKRFVVVTSRRLIVLLNRKPGVLRKGKAVCFEAPHEYLVVSRPARKNRARFALTARELDFSISMTVATPKKKQGNRLIEALEMLILEPDFPAASAPGRP